MPSFNRKRLEEWRKIRNKQDLEFQVCFLQGMIREQRRMRVTEEAPHGIKVVLYLNNGIGRIARWFHRGALFQEVYDWAGTLNHVPLYFTLHRGGKLVLHGEQIEESSIIHITERGREEAASLLASEVSFSGNYHSNEDLYATLHDGSQLEAEQVKDGPQLEAEQVKDGPQLEAEQVKDGPQLEAEQVKVNPHSEVEAGKKKERGKTREQRL